jgi:hypothetical protein
MKGLILIILVLRLMLLMSGLKEYGFKKERIVYHISHSSMIIMLLVLMKLL